MLFFQVAVLPASFRLCSEKEKSEFRQNSRWKLPKQSKRGEIKQCATRPKFAKMANYSCECVEASHIFLKNGECRM